MKDNTSAVSVLRVSNRLVCLVKEFSVRKAGRIESVPFSNRDISHFANRAQTSLRWCNPIAQCILIVLLSFLTAFQGKAQSLCVTNSGSTTFNHSVSVFYVEGSTDDQDLLLDHFTGQSGQWSGGANASSLIPGGSVTQDDIFSYGYYRGGVFEGDNFGILFDGDNNTAFVEFVAAGQAASYDVNGTRPPNDQNDGGGQPSSPPCGMPAWRVSEPYINLWLEDEPLGYQPAIGPRVSFALYYKQRESTAGYNTNIFSLGKGWDFSWFSTVSLNTNSNCVVHFPNGMERTFVGTNFDFITHTRLTGNTTNGFTLSFPDGSQNLYNLVVTNNTGGFLKAFMTSDLDPQSNGLTFQYYSYVPSTSPVVRLRYVIDGDGRTNVVFYNATNAYSSNLISYVVDAFGRSNNMAFDASGYLTNMVDVQGLGSSVAYDTNGWPTALTTPYGSTSFELTDLLGTNSSPSIRAALVIEPDGIPQLYMFNNYAPGMSNSYPSNMVPNTWPYTNTFDNAELNNRNSFHWNRNQYSHLSTTNMLSFTAQDYTKARMKHWLKNPQSSVIGGYYLGDTVSVERNPSPDSNGAIAGQITWYDYSGKTNSEYESVMSAPLFVARVLPDGTSLFERNARNLLGNITTNVNTFSANGSIALRTNIYTYDNESGIDLITVTNAIGIQVMSNAYNGYHRVVAHFDAINELTSYTYNTSQQPTGVLLPSGLVLTNIFASDGHLATNYSYSASGSTVTYFGTNIYTYSNNLVLTHTDARGLTVTNSWDNLQRLVGVDYPDGTFVANTYSKLDLVQTVDRMGFTNSFGYDSMRRKIAETNALGNYTLYGYCTCGSVESIQDAMNNVTFFYYDNQGRMTNAVYTNCYSVYYNYNLLDQMTNSLDNAGVSVTNWFNNQGLKYASSNYAGRLFTQTFDILDRVTNSINANGVTITNTYDNLNRVLSKGYSDHGVETFGYSYNGLIAYTNQLTQTNGYFYDAAGRKIAETNANGEGTEYAYSSAGDLLTLIDGKGQMTTWAYDLYGFMTNKMDANNTVILTNAYDADHRLTKRWSAAKGATSYSYDKVGSLTNISYPASPTISLAYDALNRLTNMIDGVGTSSYSYDAIGELLSEDGPWANDTVSYIYNARMRSSMSVQQPNSGPWNQTYGYDDARRLTSTASPAGGFGYYYDATARMRVAELTLPNGAYITNTYDTVARMLSTKLKNSGGTNLDAYTYQYDVGGERTNVTRTLGDFVNYTYDPIGQLTSALAKELGGVTNRLQEQFGYGYDAAHNLNSRTNDALIQTFNVNSLNELTTVARTNTLTVTGVTGALATNIVVSDGTVNRAAVLYNDTTFAATNFVPADGYNTYTATAQDSLSRASTNSVTAYLPTSASYTYDLNGNLLSDGTRNFAYDDENELRYVWVTNAWMSQFVYDGKMRRRITKEYTWSSGAWMQTNEVHYVYDGNLVVQERDLNNLPTVAYTRGNDFGGTLQMAGGIGGLLAFSRLSAINPQHYYYHCDGNGNVTVLINSMQSYVANYLYDPYGNLLSQIGAMASVNLYRFSSKEYNQDSGLIYYLYRFYDSSEQKWLTRDPIAEIGGINLFRNVRNNPINILDTFGKNTLFLGASGSATWGFAGTYTGGLLIDGKGNVGWANTYAGGLGAPACATFGLAFSVSNARDLENYKKWSLDGSVGLGYVAAGTIDGSYWPNGGGADGNSKFIEVGGTLGLGAGASVQGQVSYTSGTLLFNVFSAANAILGNPYSAGTYSYSYGTGVDNDPGQISLPPYQPSDGTDDE